jgi:hypothetical protein
MGRLDELGAGDEVMRGWRMISIGAGSWELGARSWESVFIGDGWNQWLFDPLRWKVA